MAESKQPSAEEMVHELYMADFDAWFNLFDGTQCILAGTLKVWGKEQIKRKYDEWKVKHDQKS